MLYKYLFLKSKAWFVSKARTKDHIDYYKPIAVAVLINRVARSLYLWDSGLEMDRQNYTRDWLAKKRIRGCNCFLSSTVLSRVLINTRGERPWGLTRARDNATNELLGAQLLL